MTSSKKKLYYKAYVVHFDGEAPAIGSGRRHVNVESLGPKWVKLRAPSTGRGTTIPRRQWDEIVAAAEKRGLVR